MKILTPLVLLCIFGFVLFVMFTIYEMDTQKNIFIEQNEKDCRNVNWYLEIDYISRGRRLKQVFCRDSTEEKLLFKKPMKYE